MSERRAALLRRHPDPARSTDPRVRDLVRQLAALPVSPPLRPEFRTELRDQLVAITPRIVAESKAQAATTAAAPKATPKRAVRRIPVGRVLGIAASIVTVFALLLGGAVWLSQKAVPGDALYGLKRASENVELKLDTNDSDRAQDHLKFAQRRVEEVKTLLGRTSASGAGPQAAGVSAETTKLIITALRSSDGDVQTAWTLLYNQAVRTNSGQHLDTMTNWAPGQLARLQALERQALPVALLRQLRTSSGWVTYARDHAADATFPVAPNGKPGGKSNGPVAPPRSGAVSTSGGSRPSSGSAPSKSGSGKTTSKGASGSAKSSTSRNGGVLPSLPVHLPTSSLPTLPKAPISVGKSCISLGGITVGNCSSH